VTASALHGLLGVWIVDANERSNAATAPSQPGDSTNGISVTDCVIHAGGIGIVDSGGVGHQVERCVFEGNAGSSPSPSWQGWLVGTSRAKVTDWAAEGGASGFFVGSIAPLTGVPKYPNTSLSFRECLIAPAGTGPCFDASWTAGTPFLLLEIRGCRLVWKGDHGFVRAGSGNGLRCTDNDYAGNEASFFDDPPPWSNGLIVEHTASARGIGMDCVPQIHGLDNAAQLALRWAEVSLANGQNDDVANPRAASGKLVGPDASFQISGIAGGTDGQILELAYMYDADELDIDLLHQDVGSTAENRLVCPGGTGVTLSVVEGGFAWCRLKYLGAAERWLVVGHS
jgi:hypothetical protein